MDERIIFRKYRCYKLFVFDLHNNIRKINILSKKSQFEEATLPTKMYFYYSATQNFENV